MKFLTPILFCLLPLLSNSQSEINYCQQVHKGQNFKGQISASVSDYEISHYNLHIDNLNFSTQEITGHSEITIVATLAPVSAVRLDLLGFEIDSIISSSVQLAYTYNDTVIDITLPGVVALGDSTNLTVYYNGNPQMDLSGWGGFYFSGNFAFNLGVGFEADPHNFGRAWYPCMDNFTSRSSYDFFITTVAGSKAFCNGTLQQSIVNPNGTITWHWKQNQTIPSYLTGIAVAPYYTLSRTSNGIPVEWAALPSDTNNVISTFANLDTILASFINAYGPYPFDKVGYCLIPFNSGAMEHAASIHIGSAFVNGSQTYSTLWAHELSHMWWGDKVTCETAEDMWLNEGFASYNEAYYTQIINGDVAYRDWIRSNHRKVLQFAHTPAQDGSYLTMNNIPKEYTYGYHVYQKGADVVHTLKNYMGDAAFESGCQAYMNNKAYSHASSAVLRDELTAGSGINMNRFFDDWIFTPGFPHLSIDSAIYVSGQMQVYTRQRSRGNSHIYEIPAELNFTNGINDTTVKVIIDSLTNSFSIPVSFIPTWTVMDRYEKVSDAISSNEKSIVATGTQAIAETNVTLNVQSLSSTPSTIRIEHNFVTPDPFINSNPGIKLSDYRYWKISGIINPGFLTKGTLLYDGSTSSTTGYLDNNLITGTEDSLVILYRAGAGENWQPVNSYTLNTGASLIDKRGSFTVDTLLMGEYVIGYYDYTVGVNEITNAENNLMEVSPNPSSDEFHFTLNKKAEGKLIFAVYDMGGREIYKVEPDSKKFSWKFNNISGGIYNAVVTSDGKKIASTKLVIQ